MRRQDDKREHDGNHCRSALLRHSRECHRVRFVLNTAWRRVNEAHAPKFRKGFMFEIRARFDDSVIRVYQAFSPEVALPALVAGRFVPPFKMSRMTWIKPSFNWMMYRSGFASKPGQEYVLGIDIRREGFEWALEHGVLSAFVPELHGSEKHWERLCCNSSVRIQWDPERTWDLRKVHDQKTIQESLTRRCQQRSSRK